MKKRERNGNSITKNLTFRPVVVAKAEAIMKDTGEEFAVLCARLINEKYRELFGGQVSPESQDCDQSKPTERLVTRKRS